MTPAEVLEAAANLIDEYGWGQGWHERSPLVGLCALGAISMVEGCHGGAAEILHATVGGHVHHWNDAPGRTAADVTSTMRATAAVLRAQEAQEPVCETEVV
jgi:hypothetical protein